ncbi:hypothetical protein MBLNU459_g1534t1 [Dothideomycetes sp. NU459]
MGDNSAFFYGTLMAPQVLHRVIYGMSATSPNNRHTAAVTSTPAILPSHRRHRVSNADYPAILPSSPSSSVRGTFVTGLSDADMWRLDIFEGGEYARRTVEVQLLKDDAGAGAGDAVVAEAQTYVWIAGAHRLEDREWDFETFKTEKLRFWTGRDADDRGEFDEVDEAVRAQEDGTGGRGANGHIAKALEEVHGKDRKEVVESAV